MAFDDGIAHPETLLDNSPARYGAWKPVDFDEKFHGSVTARQALQLSLNLPATQLLERDRPGAFRRPHAQRRGSLWSCRRTPTPASPSGSAASACGCATSPASMPAFRAAASRRS